MRDDLLVWDEKRGEWMVPVSELLEVIDGMIEIHERMAEDRDARSCILQMGGIAALQAAAEAFRDVWKRRAAERVAETAAALPTTKRGSA